MTANNVTPIKGPTLADTIMNPVLVVDDFGVGIDPTFVDLNPTVGGDGSTVSKKTKTTSDHMTNSSDDGLEVIPVAVGGTGVYTPLEGQAVINNQWIGYLYTAAALITVYFAYKYFTKK